MGIPLNKLISMGFNKCDPDCSKCKRYDDCKFRIYKEKIKSIPGEIISQSISEPLSD